MADIKYIQLPDGSEYNIRDTSKVPVAMGQSESNKTVITNSSGTVTTRKLVDGYTVVQSLPESSIDQNIVYLIPQQYDGGDTPITAITYALSRSGSTITLTGSNGSTSSVNGGTTESDVRDIVDDIINDILGVAY